jgi:hypothetical protein
VDTLSEGDSAVLDELERIVRRRREELQRGKK